MTHAVILLSLVAMAVAEAPYNLPRPSPTQQAFNYPAPAPQPQHQHHHHPAPQISSNGGYNYQQPSSPQTSSNGGYNYQQTSSNGGYNYQQPSIAPAFVQPNYPSQPQYQPAPQYIPQPQYNPAPQPQPIYQQPRPQPAPQQYYPAPQPQPAPQLPSTSYGVPQYPIPVQSRPVAEPIIQPVHAYITYPTQPQPQPQPLPVQPQPLPVQVYQPQPESQVQVFRPQTQQQGYSYPQPLPQSFLREQSSQQPLQSQSLGSSLSSYQADTNQYNGPQAQTHRDALDATTVNRVENIIRENEHSSARNAGYLSLVSGVSLENAKPSIEISSFVQNSPLSQSSSSGSSSLGLSSVSLDYGLPNGQISQSNSLSNFLPQTQPASSYGIPK